MTPKVYRAKYPTVEAVMFDGTNVEEVLDFYFKYNPDATVVKANNDSIRISDGSIFDVELGWYVVRDGEGNFSTELGYEFEEEFIEGDFVNPIRLLTEAIRITVEYVGNDTLPPIKGWSWFDALSMYAPETAEYFVKNPIHMPKDEEREDGNLVAHARREMELVGEDQDVIDWMVNTVRAYSSYGHSGGSHQGLLPILYQLLSYKPLSPITNDPAEWQYHDEERSGQAGGLWQNIRDPEVFSTDAGKTHYILGEKNFSDEHITFPSMEKKAQ